MRLLPAGVRCGDTLPGWAVATYFILALIGIAVGIHKGERGATGVLVVWFLLPLVLSAVGLEIIEYLYVKYRFMILILPAYFILMARGMVALVRILAGRIALLKPGVALPAALSLILAGVNFPLLKGYYQSAVRGDWLAVGNSSARLWHSYHRHLTIEMLTLSWLILQQPRPAKIEIALEPKPTETADARFPPTARNPTAAWGRYAARCANSCSSNRCAGWSKPVRSISHSQPAAAGYVMATSSPVLSLDYKNEAVVLIRSGYLLRPQKQCALTIPSNQIGNEFVHALFTFQGTFIGKTTYCLSVRSFSS